MPGVVEARQGKHCATALANWKTLPSVADVVFDREVSL
jgi:hypothetical protein